MAVIGNDRIEILEYLKRAVERLRALANPEGGNVNEAIRDFADQIAEDTHNLEAELIAMGYVPKTAGEP